MAICDQQNNIQTINSTTQNTHKYQNHTLRAHRVGRIDNTGGEVGAGNGLI